MKPLALLSAFVALVAIAGCGTQRTISVSPTTRPAPTVRTSTPGITLSLPQQPASVKAPAACPGCIGVGYDSDPTVMVELTALDGFIGRVSLSVDGLPAGITLAAPVAPVALNDGNAPSIQVVPVPLYVLPGAAPGSYQFTVVGTPVPGANSASAVSLPVTLTVTSAASAAWRSQ